MAQNPAGEPTTQASGPASQASVTPAAGTEDVYDLRVLTINSLELFGQPGFVAQGAADMAGLTGFVTKSALSAAIDTFLNQPDAGHPEGG